MNKYKVFHHPMHGFEAIKVGFSWPGFFFTWIWAFIKKLNTHGAILICVVFIADYFVKDMISEGYSFRPTRGDSWAGLILLLALRILPSFIVGKKGNEWREKSMLQKGFEFKEEIEAESVDGVLAKLDSINSENQS